MKIHHVTPTLVDGDAVCNNLMAIVELLKEQGYSGYIFCENCVRTKLDGNTVLNFSELDNNINDDDIIIYHESVGTKITDKIAKLENKVIIVYHNITPPQYFEGYNETSVYLTKWGRSQLKQLENCERFISVSDYNKQDLINEGISADKITTIPLLIEFEDYEKDYDKEVFKSMNDGKTNILFVGRVAPNKKQEDIIKSFSYYKKFINSNSRLILVGSWNGLENYYEELITLVNELKIPDVHFCSHIPFSHILAYYRTADAFLCMSEHEGFCVPVLEAMYFDVPVIAYDAAAVPETLGGASVLVEEKDYPLIAATINEVVENKDLRNVIIEKQRERLKYFDNEKIEKDIIELVNEVINNSNVKKKVDINNLKNGELEEYINPNVKKVFLHIGMHKTATTSIEHTLCFNKDLLETNNYFITERWGANLSIPLRSIFDIEPEKIDYHIKLNRSIDEIEEFNKIELHLLLEEMKATKCSNVIISGDWLSIFKEKQSVEKLKFVLDTVFPNAETKIVFVTRERNAFINSMKQELIKGNYDINDIVNPNYEYMYETYVSKYLELYGRENVIAYKFEDSIKFPIEPVGYFLEKIDFPKAEIEKINTVKVNESLSHRAIDLVFYANEKIPFYVNGGINSLRVVDDTKEIFEIRGDKYRLPSEMAKEYFYKGINDIDWLNDNLNISYPKEIYNLGEDKEIVYDIEFLEDIKEIFPNLTDLIQKLTFDYILEKLDSVKNPDSIVVLNNLKDWIISEFPNAIEYRIQDEQE